MHPRFLCFCFTLLQLVFASVLLPFFYYFLPPQTNQVCRLRKKKVPARHNLYSYTREYRPRLELDDNRNGMGPVENKSQQSAKRALKRSPSENRNNMVTARTLPYTRFAQHAMAR